MAPKPANDRAETRRCTHLRASVPAVPQGLTGHTLGADGINEAIIRGFASNRVLSREACRPVRILASKAHRAAPERRASPRAVKFFGFGGNNCSLFGNGVIQYTCKRAAGRLRKADRRVYDAGERQYRYGARASRSRHMSPRAPARREERAWAVACEEAWRKGMRPRKSHRFPEHVTARRALHLRGLARRGVRCRPRAFTIGAQRRKRIRSIAAGSRGLVSCAI